MNERIRELAEHVVGPSRLFGGEFALMGDSQVEKFGKLIVDICIDLVEDSVDHREPASTYADKIRNHFGIETNENI
jgi:hypothetical protein